MESRLHIFLYQNPLDHYEYQETMLGYYIFKGSGKEMNGEGSRTGSCKLLDDEKRVKIC